MKSFRRYLLDEHLNNNIDLFTGTVLDIGGKKINKRGRFLPPIDSVEDWIYLNPDISTKPDLCCSAEKIKINSSKINTVLMTEVIEYISDIDGALKEINRVLKKNGILIFSTPFLHPVHGDYYFDKVRYTRIFLEEKLMNNNYSIIDITEMGSLGAVIYDILRISAGYASGNKSSRLYRKFIKFLFPFFLYLDKKTTKQKKYINTGYFVIARKN